MNLVQRFVVAALLSASVLFVAGCGGGRGSVKGKVSFNGQPLADGNIGFVPKASGEGGAVSAPIKGGEYSIPSATGPMAGEYQVQITSSQKTGRKVGVAGDTGVTTDEVLQFIPENFNTKTTLTATIKAGENTHDFDLKGTPASSKGGTPARSLKD